MVTNRGTPLPEDTNYLFLDLSRRFDVRIDDLRFSRQTQPNNLRVLVVHALRDMGFGYAEIGKMLCRDHTTILALSRREIKRDELFSSILELCQKCYHNRLAIGSAVKRKERKNVDS